MDQFIAQHADKPGYSVVFRPGFVSRLPAILQWVRHGQLPRARGAGSVQRSGPRFPARHRVTANPHRGERRTDMELGLKGKTVLITGATRGIAADIALGFAEEGARVAICARTKADLDAKATEISKATGATVIGVPVDLSKRGEPERLVQEVVDRFGRLEGLVNSAGVAPGGGVEEGSDDDWERGIQLKLLGPIPCSRAAIPVIL